MSIELIQSQFDTRLCPIKNSEYLFLDFYRLNNIYIKTVISLTGVILKSRVNAMPTYMASHQCDFFFHIRCLFSEWFCIFTESYSLQSLTVPLCQMSQFTSTHPTFMETLNEQANSTMWLCAAEGAGLQASAESQAACPPQQADHSSLTACWIYITIELLFTSMESTALRTESSLLSADSQLWPADCRLLLNAGCNDVTTKYFFTSLRSISMSSYRNSATLPLQLYVSLPY